jgi:indole-3-acetate monooxygenase
MDGARAIDLPDVLERLQAQAPLIDQQRSDFDTLRCLPPAVIEALVDADLFRLWVPRILEGQRSARRIWSRSSRLPLP